MGTQTGNKGFWQNSFLKEEQLSNYYKGMYNGKEIDKLASLNFAEVIRYVEKIDKLSSIYGFLDENLTNVEFLKTTFACVKNENSK